MHCIERPSTTYATSHSLHPELWLSLQQKTVFLTSEPCGGKCVYVREERKLRKLWVTRIELMIEIVRSGHITNANIIARVILQYLQEREASRRWIRSDGVKCILCAYIRERMHNTTHSLWIYWNNGTAFYRFAIYLSLLQSLDMPVEVQCIIGVPIDKVWDFFQIQSYNGVSSSVVYLHIFRNSIFHAFHFHCNLLDWNWRWEMAAKVGKNGKLEVWKSVFRRLNSVLYLVVAREVIIWFAQWSRAHTFTLSIPCHKSTWKIQQNFRFGTQEKNETTMWGNWITCGIGISHLCVCTWNKKLDWFSLHSSHHFN